MQNSRFPAFKNNLPQSYTDNDEGHIRNFSKDTKPDYNTLTIRLFSSKGYLMGAPHHIWKKLKKLSDHHDHYENRAKTTGSLNRTHEVKSQKRNIKGKCHKESFVDGYFVIGIIGVLIVSLRLLFVFNG